MDIKTLTGAVEAVLFAVGEPITAERIGEAVGAEGAEVVSVLAALADRLDSAESGICLLQFDDRYQLSTRAAYSEFVRNALDNRRNNPLSQAALEVLAIIAYNQPVSRSFIDQVRGVDSSSSVSSLLAKGLICEAGRLELPGRPISFKTTDVFLRCFALGGLSELPPIHGGEDYADLMEMADIDPADIRSPDELEDGEGD